MNTTKNHTPLPWKFRAQNTSLEAGLSPIGRNWAAYIHANDVFAVQARGLTREEAEANAALICRAVNSHDDLLAACEHAANVFRAEIKDIDPRNELSRNDTPELAAAWHNLETMEKALTKSRTL